MPKKQKSKTPHNTVTFHYEPSVHHRIIHVDGALGGPTPKGLLAVNLYSERFPVPTEATHSIVGTKVSSEMDDAKVIQGILRQVDITALMTADVARAIAEWLLTRADELEALIGQNRVTRVDGEQ